MWFPFHITYSNFNWIKVLNFSEINFTNFFCNNLYLLCLFCGEHIKIPCCIFSPRFYILIFHIEIFNLPGINVCECHLNLIWFYMAMQLSQCNRLKHSSFPHWFVMPPLSHKLCCFSAVCYIPLVCLPLRVSIQHCHNYYYYFIVTLVSSKLAGIFFLALCPLL